MGKGVILHWIPGHVNLEGNELADQQDKLAASQAQTIQDNPMVSLQTANASLKSLKSKLAESLGQRWNRPV